MTARDDILQRISSAHTAAPPAELHYSAITRDYLTSRDDDTNSLVDLLIDRLLDYKAHVRTCTATRLPESVAVALHERGVQTAVIPSSLNPHWLSHSEVEILIDPTSEHDNPISIDDLDRIDAVVTACAMAIAETGTLVLDGSSGQGRRAITLIPDYHLCIVTADQVRADVPQAITDLDITRPITMISGPSATSDIELDRVEGVHGPRTLEVIIILPEEA